MQTHNGRIRSMIRELESWEKSLDEITERIQNVMDIEGPSGVPTEKLKKYLERAHQKGSKDLLSVFSAIRGYKLESEITIKQSDKLRKIISDSQKMGDVASKDKVTGKNRVFQAKACSTHENKDVNGHIKKAFEQVFGAHGEVPAPEAKLTVVIAIHSSKNMWPFIKKDYMGKTPKEFPSQSDFNKKIKESITKVVGSAYQLARSKAESGPAGPAKRKRDGTTGKMASYHTQFLDSIGKSRIILKLEYRKPLIDKSKKVFPRLNVGDISHVSIEIAVTKSGAVTLKNSKVAKVASKSKLIEHFM